MAFYFVDTLWYRNICFLNFCVVFSRAKKKYYGNLNHIVNNFLNCRYIVIETLGKQFL